MAPDVDIVIPTSGRPTLQRLLAALATQDAGLPGRVLVVDDRRAPRGPLALGAAAAALGDRIAVLASGGRGPAAARNVGWRGSTAEWIACLDDDVVPVRRWSRDLARDLAVADDVGASQGRVRVPPPLGRRRTDRERGVAGLAKARWISANMAYRWSALAAVNGFDERFPRPYREDADLALRLRARGWHIAGGRRRVAHPAWPCGPLASVRAQAGNADDALMRMLHGTAWRRHAGAARGRLARHLPTTMAGIVMLAGPRRLRRAGALAWGAGTLEFAWRRIAPGPRTSAEVLTMLATSVLIPPLAVAHRLAGMARARRLASPPRPPRAVLLDRDGTLIADVVANADPAQVHPMPGARPALDRLRAAGVRLAVVTNQHAVGDGRLSETALAAVNARVETLLGPFDAWAVCTHAADAECACRKPRPGGVLRALRLLGVSPDAAALIGDVGSDVAAARAAGVRAILVPTSVTRCEEILQAPEVVPTLTAAVDRLLVNR